jgi:hypothetical protein
MTELDLKEEKKIIKDEYNALKRVIGDMLVESNDHDSDEMMYYTRKLEEARKRIKR